MVRVVVVGASSGLGRCIGRGLAERGSKVALMARRTGMLRDAAEEAGNGAIAVGIDVTDPDSIRAATSEAVSGLGGLDGLVYCPAIGELGPIEGTDLAGWRRMFDTNVIGASLVTAAVLPHLEESRGSAVYLSSVSASLTPPWPGLGGYAVTKAALDKLVEAWRAEHPTVNFTRLVVGDCYGGEGDYLTQFINGWDADMFGRFHQIWTERHYIAGSFIDADDLVTAADSLLRTGSSVATHSVIVTPRPR